MENVELCFWRGNKYLILHCTCTQCTMLLVLLRTSLFYLAESPAQIAALANEENERRNCRQPYVCVTFQIEPRSAVHTFRHDQEFTLKFRWLMTKKCKLQIIFIIKKSWSYSGLKNVRPDRDFDGHFFPFSVFLRSSKLKTSCICRLRHHLSTVNSKLCNLHDTPVRILALSAS